MTPLVLTAPSANFCDILRKKYKIYSKHFHIYFTRSLGNELINILHSSARWTWTNINGLVNFSHILEIKKKK